MSLEVMLLMVVKKKNLSYQEEQTQALSVKGDIVECLSPKGMNKKLFREQNTVELNCVILRHFGLFLLSRHVTTTTSAMATRAPSRRHRRG